MSAPDHLAIVGLVKRYGDHPAVAGIDLAIAEGEFVALLGPSGCGKTTLLRCIAGLVTPSAGDIRIAGRSILDVPVWRRDLGMVFQSYALFPHMTVEKNVAFGLRMRRVARAEMAQRVAAALDLVQLRDFAGRLPAQLSGGQQQRVALARALITNPSVLLLDEPLGALDAKLREAMQVELRQLQRRLGVTTVFVTHDQGEALAMADRVAVMRSGRVEQFATAREVYDRPGTPFVAEFIGQVNRLPPGIGAPAGALAMVRPEKIGLVAPGAGRLDGTVGDIIFAGEKVTYLIVSDGVTILASARNDARIASPSPGDLVGLDWRHEDVHVFTGDQGV